MWIQLMMAEQPCRENEARYVRIINKNREQRGEEGRVDLTKVYMRLKERNQGESVFVSLFMSVQDADNILLLVHFDHQRGFLYTHTHTHIRACNKLSFNRKQNGWGKPDCVLISDHLEKTRAEINSSHVCVCVQFVCHEVHAQTQHDQSNQETKSYHV